MPAILTPPRDRDRSGEFRHVSGLDFTGAAWPAVE